MAKQDDNLLISTTYHNNYVIMFVKIIKAMHGVKQYVNKEKVCVHH